MTSTRNRNTPGDYQLEQNLNACNYSLATYIHGAHGQGYTRHLPGDGLIVAQMHSRDLAENYMDIESQLFGIGSTNLENPLPPVIPRIKKYDSLNVIDKTPMIKPEPMVPLQHQRANFRN
jgi:hypothetical protein